MIEKLRAKWEKSGLKSWTAGKIHLSRGKKLALDLVIIVLAGGWLWGLAGCPLPTVEMEFRRLERQYLLPRSEVAYQIGFWSFGGGGDIKSRDGTYLSVFEPLVVGVTGGRAYSVTLRRPGWHDVSVISLGEGPAPVPLNGTVARVPEPGRTWMSGCNLLFSGSRRRRSGRNWIWTPDFGMMSILPAASRRDSAWRTACGCFPWNHRREATLGTGTRGRRIPFGCTGRMEGSFWSGAAS